MGKYLALVKETSSISPLPGSFPPCLYQHESSATNFLSVCHRTGTFYYCSHWVSSLELPEKRRPGQGRRENTEIKIYQAEVRMPFRNPNITLWSPFSRWNIYIPSKQAILEFIQKLCLETINSSEISKTISFPTPVPSRPRHYYTILQNTCATYCPKQILIVDHHPHNVSCPLC